MQWCPTATGWTSSFGGTGRGSGCRRHGGEAHSDDFVRSQIAYFCTADALSWKATAASTVLGVWAANLPWNESYNSKPLHLVFNASPSNHGIRASSHSELMSAPCLLQPGTRLTQFDLGIADDRGIGEVHVACRSRRRAQPSNQ